MNSNLSHGEIHTIEEFIAMKDDYGGWCLACGEEAFGIEPDAREYKCEFCGEHKVYGCEEWLIMGLIQ